MIKRSSYVEGGMVLVLKCNRRIDVIGLGNSTAGAEQGEVDDKEVGFEGFKEFEGFEGFEVLHQDLRRYWSLID